jgi:transposase-like protein
VGWVDQLRKEGQGKVPVGTKATISEQKRIQHLQALLKQKDMDIETLKRLELSCFRTPKIVCTDRRARPALRHQTLLPGIGSQPQQFL